MRWSVVLASPCLSTQDALRGGRKSEQGARAGRRGAVVTRWWVTDESWPSSDVATGYEGHKKALDSKRCAFLGTF